MKNSTNNLSSSKGIFRKNICSTSTWYSFRLFIITPKVIISETHPRYQRTWEKFCKSIGRNTPLFKIKKWAELFSGQKETDDIRIKVPISSVSYTDFILGGIAAIFYLLLTENITKNQVSYLLCFLKKWLVFCSHSNVENRLK